MVAGHAFVIGDGLYIQSQTMLRIPLVDVDAARARTVLRSRRVVRGYGIPGAKRIHRNYHKLVLRQASEEPGELGFPLAGGLCIEMEDLFARRSVKTPIFLDVVVQAGHIVEAELVSQRQHLGFGLGDLLEADLVNLLRREVSRGEAPD